MDITKHLIHTITYWVVTGSDSYGGYTFDIPALMKARWDDEQEKFVTAVGEESVSRAVVFLEDDLTVGDYIALGDCSLTNDPTTLNKAYPIRAFSRVTNLRGNTNVRRAFL